MSDRRRSEKSVPRVVTFVSLGLRKMSSSTPGIPEFVLPSLHEKERMA